MRPGRTAPGLPHTLRQNPNWRHPLFRRPTTATAADPQLPCPTGYPTEVPAPARPGTTARLRRVGPIEDFRRSVAFDGHAAAGGYVRLASHGPSPTSILIVTDAADREVGRDYDDRQTAVEALAQHHGLALPVTLSYDGGLG